MKNKNGGSAVLFLLVLIAIGAFVIFYKDKDGKTLIQKSNTMFDSAQENVEKKTVGDFQNTVDKREQQIEEVTGESY